jgi:hypothetical protein
MITSSLKATLRAHVYSKLKFCQAPEFQVQIAVVLSLENQDK